MRGLTFDAPTLQLSCHAEGLTETHETALNWQNHVGNDKFVALLSCRVFEIERRDLAAGGARVVDRAGIEGLAPSSGSELEPLVSVLQGARTGIEKQTFEHAACPMVRSTGRGEPSSCGVA